jgi:hypothetical protein
MDTSFQNSYTNHSVPTRRVLISRTLTGFAGVCIMTYMVLMVQTISLINERKDIRESIRQTQIAISDGEVQYFKLAQSIDTSTMQALGFTESTVPVFAYTHPNFATVALSR